MYVWLSFCDPNKPEGERFLGVSVVEADNLPDAMGVAWLTGCNPGGEIQGFLMDKVVRVPNECLHRLLSRDEAMALDNWIANKHRN